MSLIELTPILCRSLPGAYIAVDGPDGSGKSTLVGNLASVLRDHKVPVEVVREPGSTYYGEKIRSLLLDHPPGGNVMDVRCELMLFMAARAQMAAEKIAPLKQAGVCILSDRSVASTFAYQVFDMEIMTTSEMWEIYRAAVPPSLQPQLFLLLNARADVLQTRRKPQADRIEIAGAAYHDRVCRGYNFFGSWLEASARRVDASPPALVVLKQVLSELEPYFFKHNQPAWQS